MRVTTSRTQGFDANIANAKRQRIVRLDKVYCPFIFGNDGSYIANVQCSLPHSQFAMLGNAKFMHHSRRTLCLGFVSCGQQPPAEQVMRHNITHQRECTCQVTLKFVDPFVDSGFVLSGAGLLKHNGLIGSVASFTLRDCVSACTLRLFASPRILRFVAYRYALFRSNSRV